MYILRYIFYNFELFQNKSSKTCVFTEKCQVFSAGRRLQKKLSLEIYFKHRLAHWLLNFITFS